MTNGSNVPPPPWADDPPPPSRPPGGGEPPQQPPRQPPEAPPPQAPRPSRGPEPPTPEQRARFRGSAASSMVTSDPTPMWKILSRVVIPVVLILAGFSLYARYASRTAFTNYIDYETIMGFDSHLLDGLEEMAATEGYKIGPEGAQGWVLGGENRWIITIDVQVKACFVVPYYVTYRFTDDLPVDGHTQQHLENFLDDGWYMDQQIINQFRTFSGTRDVSGIIPEMQKQIWPPP